MRIHTDANGLAVNAISRLADGTEVDGHQYNVIAGSRSFSIEFQRGPVKENGVNGATNEALLAILLHRTRLLDAKFPCGENKVAIEHMEQALSALEWRTRRRVSQGVEGTDQPHRPGWVCSSCCMSFPDGMPLECGCGSPGCNELLRQGK